MRHVFVVILPLLFTLAACVNSRRAEVNLANNPAGVDCFTKCVSGQLGESGTLNCVGSCPGAVFSDDDCDGRQACVEERSFSKVKTGLIVIAVAVIVIFFAAGGAG
jgi:hypothetical protein